MFTLQYGFGQFLKANPICRILELTKWEQGLFVAISSSGN